MPFDPETAGRLPIALTAEDRAEMRIVADAACAAGYTHVRIDPEHVVSLIDARDSLSTRLASVTALAEELADEFDAVLAAHDPQHPQHRSHGGQHHNGRCCAFGNVNPSSLREFRFLRDRIRAELRRKEG